LLIAVVSVVVVGGVGGIYVYNLPRAPVDNIASTCHDPDSVRSHVYNPDRLEVVSQCVTVSGTVENVLPERDGDYHIRLRLDPAYANLTNESNDRYQYGDLVVEIICARAVTQPDAITACENYSNPIPIPTIGQHITVSGPYVLDTDHYGWAEIHPVYSLTIS
jgi:hypothetical protein